MTVLITGANGHIGANLVRALIERNQPTRCLLHVNSKAIEGLAAEGTEGDIRDVESLCKAFHGIDTVYHLAANISLSMDGWKRMEETNVAGTRNVVEACLRTGVRRLVHFSSIHALQAEPLSEPIDESRPLVEWPGCAPYERSKAAGEREVRKGIEKGLDAVIIYPTAVIGPHDYQPSYLGEAILMMANGRLPALVPGGYDWVDARDVAVGAITAAEKAPAGASYLLSGQWVSMYDMAAMVEIITGVPSNKFLCPFWLARIGAVYFKAVSRFNGKQPLYTSMSLKALQSNKHISHDKATRELGYNPRPFRETLEDSLRWFSETGKLKAKIKI